MNSYEMAPVEDRQEKSESPKYSINPLFPHFLQNVEKGKHTEIDDSKIQRHFQKCLEEASLTPLSNEEKQELRSYILESVDAAFDLTDIRHKELIENVTHVRFSKKSYERYQMKAAEDLSSEEQKGYKPMTHQEKLDLLSSPEVWQDLEVPAYGGVPFIQGSRPLFDENPKADSYGYSREEATEILRNAHARTGKKKISVLDVGGNIGLALSQIKELDPNVETYNLTLSTAPITFPVDHLEIRPAEIFPTAYANRMDVIFSNFAFTYFLRQDVALENCIKALSVGGEARMTFSFKDSPIWSTKLDPTNSWSGIDRKKIKEKFSKILENISHFMNAYINEGVIELEKGELPDKDTDPGEYFTFFVIRKKKKT